MTPYLLDVFVVIAAYLVGSVSCAIIVSKLYALPDPRTCHSGNPGATNVLRSGGRKAGLLTLCGDFAKGAIPLLIVKEMNFALPSLAAVAAATFFGHLFPLYHGFRGGKGVATLWGCLCGLGWWMGLIWVGLWLFILGVSRYVSIASILISLFTPIIVWWFSQSMVLTSAFTIMGMMVVWRHRGNIQRLQDGTENKFQKK